MSYVTLNLDANSQHYACETENDGSAVFRVVPGTYTLTASLPGWKISSPPQRYVMTKNDFEIAHLFLAPSGDNHTLKTTRVYESIPTYCL